MKKLKKVLRIIFIDTNFKCFFGAIISLFLAYGGWVDADLLGYTWTFFAGWIGLYLLRVSNSAFEPIFISMIEYLKPLSIFIFKSAWQLLKMAIFIGILILVYTNQPILGEIENDIFEFIAVAGYWIFVFIVASFFFRWFWIDD